MQRVRDIVERSIVKMTGVDDVPEDLVNEIASELSQYGPSPSDDLVFKLIESYRFRIMGRLLNNIRRHMPGKGSVERALPMLVRESLEELGYGAYLMPAIHGERVDLALNLGTHWVPAIVIGHSVKRRDMYRVSRLRSMGMNPLIFSMDEDVEGSVRFKVDFMDGPPYYRLTIAPETLRRGLGESALVSGRFVKWFRVNELAYSLWRGLRLRGYLAIVKRGISEIEAYGFGKYLVRIQSRPTMWEPSYRLYDAVIIVSRGSGVRVRGNVEVIGLSTLERLIGSDGLSVGRLKALASRVREP